MILLLTLLKELGSDEENNENDIQREPKSEVTEKKIIEKGSILLKRLIPLEEYLRQVKEFKKNASNFNPENVKVEDILKLEDNLLYQNCALNVEEFFLAGVFDVFATLRELIKKEINFIEGFKRLKANETNPKFKEICDASNKRLHMQLGVLQKIEDEALKKYKELNDSKFKKLIMDIIELNAEIINKSTDSLNLIDHLSQLRNNVPFIRSNEKELIDDKKKTPTENYITVLVKSLVKSLHDEDLCDGIIKTLIALCNKKPTLCNLLVKLGCPRLLKSLEIKIF